jgi:hypothetical protein
VDVGALIAITHSQQGFPERPPTRPRPDIGVQIEGVSEGAAAGTGKQRPCENKVACRIADVTRAEVDHPGEPPAGDKKVPDSDIAMEPHRRSVYVRFQRFVPHGGCPRDINAPGKFSDAAAGLVVVHRRRFAAMKTVLTRKRSARAVHPLQSEQELADLMRERNEIADSIDPGRLAGKPTAYGPRKRVTVTRPAREKRLGWTPAAVGPALAAIRRFLSAMRVG